MPTLCRYGTLDTGVLSPPRCRSRNSRLLPGPQRRMHRPPCRGRRQFPCWVSRGKSGHEKIFAGMGAHRPGQLRLQSPGWPAGRGAGAGRGDGSGGPRRSCRRRVWRGRPACARRRSRRLGLPGRPRAGSGPRPAFTRSMGLGETPPPPPSTGPVPAPAPPPPPDRHGPCKNRPGAVATTRIHLPAMFIEAPLAPRQSPQSALRQQHRRGAPPLRAPRLRPTQSNPGPSRCPPRSWRTPPAQHPLQAVLRTPPRACPRGRGCAPSTAASAIARSARRLHHASPKLETLAHHPRLVWRPASRAARGTGPAAPPPEPGQARQVVIADAASQAGSAGGGQGQGGLQKPPKRSAGCSGRRMWPGSAAGATDVFISTCTKKLRKPLIPLAGCLQLLLANLVT